MFFASFVHFLCTGLCSFNKLLSYLSKKKKFFFFGDGGWGCGGVVIEIEVLHFSLITCSQSFSLIGSYFFLK